MTQASPMQDELNCRFDLGPVVGRGSDCCQRYALHYSRVFDICLSQLYGFSVVLLHRGDKTKLFLYCVCNEVKKAGGKGRCTTTVCLAVEEGLLPPAKLSALFNREVVLKVAGVCPTTPGKAQGHPCNAFQSVLSSA